MPTHPFDLNLRHLRALIAITEQGSISGAADQVSLSQPALTQGLAKLEDQFGCAFFERRPDGMVATRMGQLVIDRTRSALGHLSVGAGIHPGLLAAGKRADHDPHPSLSGAGGCGKLCRCRGQYRVESDFGPSRCTLA